MLSDKQPVPAAAPSPSGAASTALPPGWEEVPCDLCGSAESDRVRVLADYLLGKEGRFAQVRCRSCGLVGINPRPGPAAIASYYPAAYHTYGGVPETAIFRAKRELLRAAFAPGEGGLARPFVRLLFHLLRDYFPGYPVSRASGTLIDIGCGTGHFITLLERTGLWQTAGLEPDAALVADLCAAGMDVRQGITETAAFDGRRFDVVRMWHVFEHLHSPTAGLRRARDLLVPGGELVIGVPAVDSLAARCFGRHWFGHEAPRHLYHYSKPTLCGLLEANGFSVCTVRRTEARSIFGSLQFAWNDLRRRQSGRPRYGGRLFARRGIVLAYQPFELLINWCGLGDSLTVHALKTDAPG